MRVYHPTASAVDFNDGTLKYTTSGTSATVTGLVNTSATITDLTIPSTVNNEGTTYKVTKIGNNAFKGATNISGTLTMTENLAEIGMAAF